MGVDWTVPDLDYVGAPARCRCGHHQCSHLRDLTSGEDTGRCCRGSYGPRGVWVGGGCPCRRFVDETVAQTDMLDQLLADR